MNALLDWFSSFSETIASIIGYFSGVIEDIVEMVVMLGYAAADLPTLFSFLPPPVVTLLTVFLTAAILYKILGRES